MLVVLVNNPASADCLDDVSRFAASICGVIQNEGHQIVRDSNGNLGASANGVLKKVIGGGDLSFGGGTATSDYIGPIREQLVDDRFNVLQCKQHMVEVAYAKTCSDKQKSDNRLTVTDAWYGVGGRECHAIFRRFAGCNGKQSCQIQCDNSSDCRDPAKHRGDKVCMIFYRCGDGQVTSKQFPESSGLGTLACE